MKHTAAIALAALLGLALTALPAQAGGNKGAVKKDRIEGVWDAKVNIIHCHNKALITSFDALGIFAANGIFHDTNSTNPVLRSSHFGTWRHVRDNRYKFAFKFFRFDAAGIPLGSQIVRHTVVLAGNGKTYVSKGTAEFYDTDGNLVMEGCSNATAKRFK